MQREGSNLTRMNQSVWRRVTEVAALTMACALIPVGIASAGTPAHQQDGDSSESSADGSYIESVERINGRQQIVNVYAASMDRTVPIQVITPADNSVPRPILYLLNGAGGGEDSATWEYQTDVVDFFQDKNVNVVTPVGGRLSYYTDWEKEDPKLGKNMWSTFLGKELPPLLNKQLGSNGDQSLAAISMSGYLSSQFGHRVPRFLQVGCGVQRLCANQRSPRTAVRQDYH